MMLCVIIKNFLYGQRFSNQKEKKTYFITKLNKFAKLKTQCNVTVQSSIHSTIKCIKTIYERHNNGGATT